MERGSQPKPNGRNAVSLKKFHVDAISANYDVIFIVHIYCGDELQQFGRQIPHAWSIILKFSLIVTFSTISLSKSHIFYIKILIFYKKMLTLAKLRKTWHYKEHFLKLHMLVQLRTKLQVLS